MANTKISALTAATVAAAANEFAINEAGTSKKLTGTLLRNFTNKGIPVHNVLDYGAVGDSNSSTAGGTDDTVAIAATYTAAAASGGYAVVLFPGQRTFRTTASITVPVGVHTLGTSGRQLNGNGDPPHVLWDGAANGTIFDVVDAGGGLFGCRFTNLLITGCAGAANYPGKGIRFSGAKTDSGTLIDNCWIQSIQGSPGNGVSIEGGGSTNFRMSGGRLDSNAGYGVYVSLATGDDFIGVFDQGVNWVGGLVQGKGMLHLDGEAATSGGTSHVTFVSPHTEENQNMTDTWASGVGGGLDGSGRTIYPSDKRGVVRLGVYPASFNLQHDIRVLGWDHSAGANSHCIFQVTSTAGTSRAAAACVSIQGMGASGLNVFNTSDATDPGEVRLIGGNIPDDERWPHHSYRIGDFKLGRGKTSNDEGVRHYVNTDLYMMRGLAHQPCTYANRSPVAVAGSVHVFLDANVANGTAATVSSGGGSTVVFAFYNGSNWIAP